MASQESHQAESFRRGLRDRNGVVSRREFFLPKVALACYCTLADKRHPSRSDPANVRAPSARCASRFFAYRNGLEIWLSILSSFGFVYAAKGSSNDGCSSGGGCKILVQDAKRFAVFPANLP
jgi:hypothetical protein